MAGINSNYSTHKMNELQTKYKTDHVTDETQSLQSCV